MASVFDVAAYILGRCGPMTHMKLQKLVYYSQAWGLVWDEAPLFDQRIEAWANGPVCPELYNAHQGEYMVNREPRGSAEALVGEQIDTVEAVLEVYGDKPAHWLSDLTHREAPWLSAREGIDAGVRSNREISHASMAEFYSEL